MTSGGTEKVTIRNASTVVLARDSEAGPEVFMLERNIKSEFVSGAYVFPGGAVDRHDTHQRLEQICVGLTDAVASAATGLSTGVVVNSVFCELKLNVCRHGCLR